MVEVSSTENCGRKPGVRFHHTKALDSLDLRCKRGLPVTSPARTLIDLAAVMNERALERSVDEAILRRLIRERELVDALDRTPRRPGVGRLRRLLGDSLVHGAGRSDVERSFRRLVRAAELPTPDFNVRLGPYELDALWRDYRLAVEIDTYRFHGGRAPFESDRIRDANLSDLKPLRFTDRRLARHPEAVVATVARELAHRGWTGP